MAKRGCYCELSAPSRSASWSKAKAPGGCPAFGLGQGGFTLTASELRPRYLANRFAEQERVAEVRRAAQRRREELRAKRNPARKPS